MVHFFLNSKSHVGGEEEIFLMTFWLMNFSKISIRAILIFSFFIFGFSQLVVSISLKVLKISEASFSVRVTSGDRETDVYRTVEQYPIFAKAGAIVPMEGFEGGNSLGRKTDMELYVFAGADNTFTMYEDEGEYSRFETGVWAKTDIELKWGETAEITIHAADGERSLLPEKRNWTVKLRGFKKPEHLKISADGKESETDFEYDEEHATVTIAVNGIDTDKDVKIICVGNEGLLYDNSFTRQRIFNIILHSQIGYPTKMKIWEYLKRPVHNRLFMTCTEPEQQVLLRAVEEMLGLEEK